MTNKLIPDNPAEVMVIRQVTPNISTLSVPFARFGKILIGGRGTLVRLQSGSIAVFSPVALTDDVRAHITSLGGTVRYLICPDIEHHIFLGQWYEAFSGGTGNPNGVKVVGPEGLREKREKQADAAVPFDVTFAGADRDRRTRISDEFDAEFEYEYFHSHPNKEIVFCHKPDRTLVQADLLFNLPATEQYSRAGGVTGFMTAAFTYLTATKPEAAANRQRKFVWHTTASSDRPSFNASAARVNGWKFDKIVPCHGDVIESGGNEVFRSIFGWCIDAASAASEAEKPKA